MGLLQSKWVPLSQADSSPHLCAGTALATALWLAGAMAGTGGSVPEGSVKNRMGTGSPISGRQGAHGHFVANGLSAKLDTIRSALRLSVAELAELLGVSRPTIYSWQRGGSSTETHAARIRTIVNALEPHLAQLSVHSGRIARRAIDGRASLLEILRSGEPPQEAIGRLVDVLQQDAAQRRRLAHRLQGKTIARGSADIDVLG